jgi:hypothetical protein
MMQVKPPLHRRPAARRSEVLLTTVSDAASPPFNMERLKGAGSRR